MKYKIVFVIYSLSKGGAEKIFSILANNLNRDKFNCFIVVFNLKDFILPLNSDVNVINLNTKRSFKGIFSLLRVVLKIRPNIVFSTLIPINLIVGILRPIIKLLNFSKIYFILRESSIPSINLKYSKRKPLYYFLMRRLYPKFDLIVAQSNDMADDLTNNFCVPTEKLRIINNPAINIPKEYTKSRVKVRDKLIFITVGSLRPEKGHCRVLEALNLLPKNLKYEYLIVGDGSERLKILNQIYSLGLNNSVKLIGESSNVGEYFSKAHLFLQGSYSEGFPNSLLESISFQVPVVAFDVLGGTKEIILDGFNGFLVRDNDLNGFANAILKSINYTFELEKFPGFLESKFSKEKIIKEYEKLFLSCVES